MLINASFYGTIQSDLYGKFFIEPSRRYGKSQSSEDIIYHENGINLNHFYSKEMLPMKNFSRIRNFFEENHQESFLLDYQTVGCGSTNKTIDTMMAYEKNGNLMMEKEELKVTFYIPELHMNVIYHFKDNLITSVRISIDLQKKSARNIPELFLSCC